MEIPEIEIIFTDGDGRELVRRVLRPGHYVIGRNADCDLHVDADLVSRRHAQLTINFDHLTIEDLGSSNGTQVNGHPVTEETRLWPNQKVRIGSTTLEFRRLKTATPPDASLAPTTAAVKRLVPEELLRDKKYEIGGVVAEGGMGAILSAREATIERTVAMKVMLTGWSPDDLSRFVAEVRITGQLEHPNIVPVHELGVDENNQVYYTMKFVRGVTLKAVIENLAAGDQETIARYPLAALLTIFQKVCDAVAFAHSKRVIHRDIKPENVMLGDYGEVLLMDWGLAKVLGQRPPKAAKAPGSSAAHSQTDVPADSGTIGSTLTGTTMGTPHYMAPEQARGEVETLDARADIYSLGATLYHILSLRRSVTGETPMEVVAKVGRGETDPLLMPAGPNVPPLRHLPGARIPESLAAVVRKAMAFENAKRYGNVGELQADITAYQNGFATSAEEKTVLKRLALFLKRHRGVSTSLAGALLLLVAVSVAFIVSVVGERNRSSAALADLRATAPTFFSQAKLLTEQEDLEGALEKITIALKFDPANADFHAERGDILQSLERFEEAASEYTTAAMLNRKEPHAMENAKLSKALAVEKAQDGAISMNQRIQWRDALVAQGREGEAILAGRGLRADVKKMLPAWQARLDDWLGKNAPKITVSGNGLRLSLINLQLTDLSPLSGMPLIDIDVSQNPHLTDLSPLADSPLETFNAMGDSDLSDLSPLKGKKLRIVDLRGTNVSDLTPLAGMPLRSAALDDTPVSDLKALRGTRLKFLSIQNTKVSDLGPLAGQPLEQLDARGSEIASLAPVGDAPLEYLRMDSPFDLALLRAHRLRTLIVQAGIFEHPEELAKMTNLEILMLPPAFSDPAPLRNLPYLQKIDFAENANLLPQDWKSAEDFFRAYDTPAVRAVRQGLVRCGLKDVPLRNVRVDPDGLLCVDLDNTSITDLSPLSGLPINELNLTKTSVTDIGPLRGMPLAHIRLQGTHVRDVAPLADCPTLEWIELPPKAINVESLRALKNLRYLSANWDRSARRPLQTVEEFWKQYDAMHPD